MVDAAFLQEKGEFNATRQNLRIFRQPILCFCNYFPAEKNIRRHVLIWRFCANFASPKLNIENRHKKHPRKSSVTAADGALPPFKKGSSEEHCQKKLKTSGRRIFNDSKLMGGKIYFHSNSENQPLSAMHKIALPICILCKSKSSWVA